MVAIPWFLLSQFPECLLCYFLYWTWLDPKMEKGIFTSFGQLFLLHISILLIFFDSYFPLSTPGRNPLSCFSMLLLSYVFWNHIFPRGCLMSSWQFLWGLPMLHFVSLGSQCVSLYFCLDWSCQETCPTYYHCKSARRAIITSTLGFSRISSFLSCP